jgi:hypothetical protein
MKKILILIGIFISFLVCPIVFGSDKLLSREILVQDYKLFKETEDVIKLWSNIEGILGKEKERELIKNLAFLSACHLALVRNVAAKATMKKPIEIQVPDLAFAYDKTDTLLTRPCDSIHRIKEKKLFLIDILLFTGDLEKLSPIVISMGYKLENLLDIDKLKDVLERLCLLKAENPLFGIVYGIIGDEFMKLEYLIIYFKLNIIFQIENEKVRQNLKNYMEGVNFKQGRLSK